METGILPVPAIPGYTALETLWHDKDLVLLRGRRESDRSSVLLESAVRADAEPRVLAKIERGFSLRGELDPAWALDPVHQDRVQGRPFLVFEDPGGDILSRSLGTPRALGESLRIAVGIASALRELHARGLIHKDLKPDNVLIDGASRVRLRGFGLASRLPREHQDPGPPEVIAGSLPYMSPEQTGRMNRSLDSRSDLYSLGVTLYELFTGALPFEADDPMEWVHCHLARQALPPHERSGKVPVQVSAIVMKLLSKTAEERYQTAAGVEADLRLCLGQWESGGAIASFTLGARDVPARLMIPEKLYGREEEAAKLLAAFERVETAGTRELVLVSGYSGIGKSSLVNELHRAIVRPRGIFVSGKFERQRQGAPHFVFIQAFEALIGRILAGSPEEVAAWRAAILEAVGSEGRILTDLLPQLALVIGPQPDVPVLSLMEARNRLHATFVKFLGAIARPEHPLVLFLDDLQWLDGASFALFEHLATHPDLGHLLLVGAYRDNEVGPSHPLRRTLDTIRAAGVAVEELRLAPLTVGEVCGLVADTLHRPSVEAGPLAEIIHGKTGGNPFFTLQFLHFLEDEHLLAFDAGRGTWTWDLARIRAQGITDNVAEMVVEKLERLPAATSQILQRMACLGSTADTPTLGRALERTESQIREGLWPAVLAGMVTTSGELNRFLHDRVQEAAYSLIPESRRAATHLAIGRLLLADRSPESVEEDVFQLVEQFDRGMEELREDAERRLVRRLNTVAGRKALASTAYGSASVYLARARALLPLDAWDVEYAETFALVLDAAESDFMAGSEERGESLFAEVLGRARSRAERAEVFRRRSKLHRYAGRYQRALEICIAGLAVLDVIFPPASDAAAIGAAIGAGMARLQAGLGGRRIADLADAPPTEDPEARAVIALAAEALGPAYYGKSPYLALAALAGASVSLAQGPAADSPILYNVYAFLLSAAGDVETAQRITEMVLRLHDRVGDETARGSLLVSVGTIIAWRRPFAACAGMLEEAFRANVRVGNMASAGDAAVTVLWARFEAGEPLDRLAESAAQYLSFARTTRNESVYHMVRLFLRFLDSFRGTRSPGSHPKPHGIAEPEQERAETAPSLAAYEKSGFTAGIAMFHIQSAISAFTFGRPAEALSHTREAALYVTEVMFTLQERNQPFFQALAAAALHDSAPLERRRELSAFVTAALEPLRKMAEYGPANYGDRITLLQAEIARMEGRDLEAMRLYDEAIVSARDNGLLHRESLAQEIAGRFYSDRGFETIAHAYLRNARAGYLRWRATAKVKQLDREYPGLQEPARANGGGAAVAPLQDLDLLAVVRASQAVSGEIVLERFVEKLLTLMLESAGAERAALIRPRASAFLVEAEATATRKGVEVRIVNAALDPDRFPESMLRFVARTRERVLLDDATAPNPHSEDPYVVGSRPRSVLVLPLLKQSALVALLYLENRLATRAFTSGQVAVVQLLASQAAISLENARLYQSLERAEERFSKAFRDSPSPMAIVRMKDEIILDANARFLETYGLSREELLGHSLRQLGLIDRDEARRLADLVAARGVLRDEEIAVRNKQGQGLSLLASMEPIDLDGEDCAFITHVDITARKQMELQLRQSQKMEAIGRLAGGVAHDFNNLLTVINGSSIMALGEMDASNPHYELLREILDAGERAAGLTRQLLAHSRTQVQQMKPWNLNGIVEAIVPMLKRLIAEDTRLETELDASLGQARVDRGQVEQILLNLVVNARDASPRGGRIVIRTGNIGPDHDDFGPRGEAARGPHIMLEVSDTGSGMTPEVKARLFEPFFTTKPQGKGTGLGLSVVYGIVKQSGGAISIHSEPGQGTSVRIYFPEVAAAGANVFDPGASPDAGDFRGDEIVLLVEDAEPVRRFGASALQAQGYLVTEAGSGEEALRVLAARPDIQIVVTDVVMPDMGGAVLATRIRALRPALPILFMSGFVEHAEVLDVIAASGERLLQKPFTPSELARKVRETLEGHRRP